MFGQLNSYVSVAAMQVEHYLNYKESLCLIHPLTISFISDRRSKGQSVCKVWVIYKILKKTAEHTKCVHLIRQLSLSTLIV